MIDWLRFIRPGDWAVLAGAAMLVSASWSLITSAGPAQKALVRANGRLVAELPLTAKRVVEVAGPLGVTRIEVDAGRARVASDPGPRQYCVKQGWLTIPDAMAICAPNQVSLTLVGRSSRYDTVNY